MGGELVYNHADYRLMSKRALKGLLEFDEVNIFLRGMVPMVGYQSDIVTYERAERFAGESKYPLKKMLSFAFEGITSLSVKPIKMIFNVGILICVISVLAIIYCLVRLFYKQHGKWLDQSCYVDMVFRWFTADRDWDGWTIYWKNIFGDKGQT